MEKGKEKKKRGNKRTDKGQWHSRALRMAHPHRLDMLPRQMCRRRRWGGWVTGPASPEGPSTSALASGELLSSVVFCLFSFRLSMQCLIMEVGWGQPWFEGWRCSADGGSIILAEMGRSHWLFVSNRPYGPPGRWASANQSSILGAAAICCASSSSNHGFVLLSTSCVKSLLPIKDTLLSFSQVACHFTSHF